MASVEGTFLHGRPGVPELDLAGEGEGSVIVGCLWFLMIGFMFFAQHHVCDAYFVPAINVFVERMRASPIQCAKRWGEEAVAGATICALGCNGPELFTNLISLYTCSDAGIGVVVGSEIFNLLIIIGCSILAAPVLPLVLERAPFTRDCAFYAISIALLYKFMQDKQIDFTEAAILLGAAVVFVASVYFTTDIVNAFGSKAEEVKVGERKGAGGRMHGVDVEVKEVVHSRMMDARASHATSVDMQPTKDGLRVSWHEEPRPNARGSVGFQLANPDALLGPMLRYDNLTEVAVMAEGSLRLEFTDGFMQNVTLIVKAEDAAARTELLKSIERYDDKLWVHDYDATVVGAVKHLKHTMTNKQIGLLMKLVVIPEFLIDCLLKTTLFAVDVKDVTKEGRWPFCFVGAMFWLAMFSWGMLEVSDAINYNIPAIPTAFLGITVCAIGTSFPNAVASVIMSSQNKPAAAVANALGSNVQNVFLAMAFPWVIFMFFPYLDCGVYQDETKQNLPHTNAMASRFQPLRQDAAGLTEGILWMIGTLILLLIFVVLPPLCALTKKIGYVLIVVYLVYFVLTCCETFMHFTLVE